MEYMDCVLPELWWNNKISVPGVWVSKKFMAFFTAAIDTLKVLVIALGAGLGVWGVINLLEGYGNDNPGANAYAR